MSSWRQLVRGLRTLIDRQSADTDVADEVQHYVEQATAAHLARGLSIDEAIKTYVKFTRDDMRSIAKIVEVSGNM